MAVAPAAWRTADEFVTSALGELGPGQRGLVFVLDPDATLSLPEHGDATIQDSGGENWQVFGYRGNDMALRARLRLGAPTVVWVRPGLPHSSSSVVILRRVSERWPD